MKKLIVLMAGVCCLSSFGARKGILPEGYERIAYIETPKELGEEDYSFVDTGYQPGTNTVIECEVDIATNQIGEVVCPFGTTCRDERRSVNVFIKRGVEPKIGVATGADVVYTSGCFRVGMCEWLRFDAASGELSNAAGGSVHTGGLIDKTIVTLHIFGTSPFARHKCETCRMKLYAFRIKEGDRIVHDFIPCRLSVEDRSSDKVGPGLYDCVSGHFYPVVGPKPFAAGFADEKVLAYMSATELLAKFKTCEIKPSEVLEAQISRVKQL